MKCYWCDHNQGLHKDGLMMKTATEIDDYLHEHGYWPICLTCVIGLDQGLIICTGEPARWMDYD